MLPHVPEETDALSAYQVTRQALEQYKSNMHSAWFNTLEPGISKALATPLLLQDKAERARPDRTFWQLCMLCPHSYR
jgi:hypothetical protein